MAARIVVLARLVPGHPRGSVLSYCCSTGGVLLLCPQQHYPDSPSASPAFLPHRPAPPRPSSLPPRPSIPPPPGCGRRSGRRSQSPSTPPPPRCPAAAQSWGCPAQRGLHSARSRHGMAQRAQHGVHSIQRSQRGFRQPGAAGGAGRAWARIPAGLAVRPAMRVKRGPTGKSYFYLFSPFKKESTG